ncbi:OmpA family protein [Sphingobacterium spiritivorum ATCC 33300]|uniref:OmpA family protein n=1 Tax=Sphingobacterium spiritivorum ATCC 33300 TaxID=525372 RepID=C2FUH3_SPHSI|nr:OmpA family protein [Sphingobacterium spiritivorum]EEI93442.1 OmpA family protein [Sphingobacterium spiritivorum ATCC 33300]QQS95890.1 OmpA family protein [Sphingobacterium spiritivorum]
MRIISLLFIALCISLTGYSQQTIRKDTTVVTDNNRYKVITNTFWSNWFLGAGAGAQVYFGDHNKQAPLSENLTPHFGLHLGKWFSPGLGLRLGAGGYQIKGLTQNGSHSTGEVYDASKWLDKQKFNYYHVYGDMLFNLSNIFSGYNANRIYNISPYLGLGWMITNDQPKQREISANLGIYNTFRLAEALDLTLDIRGSMVNDRFDGETGRRKEEGTLSALIGLTYKFKKRGWDKSKTTIISYDEEELNALRRRVNELAANNDVLSKQLEEAGNKSMTNVVVNKNVLAAPILVTFKIGTSEISNETRVNLGFFAKVIKEGDAQVIYRITGYADKGTGTPEINQRLSIARAEAVKSILVNEFAVPARQLTTVAAGGVDNMYYNDPKLSRAVIAFAE